MSNRPNLSRTYRPQTFEAMLGQEPIVTTLRHALQYHTIAPAYLFCGPRGTGKTTIARIFAKALNCHHLRDGQEPCNACPSCKGIIEGRSLDVLEIDGASNRGIDDARKINEGIGYSTGGGRYQIYIIDEVHMLTKEAFNALLKTLEEPPPNVRFLFATTEPLKIPTTILSRCQRFELKRIPSEKIVTKLRTISTALGSPVEHEALQLMAQRAEGALRDAESLLEQLLCFNPPPEPITYRAVIDLLGITPRSLYMALDQAIASHRLEDAFTLSQELFTKGKEVTTVLDELLDHFRTYLALHFKLPPPTVLPPDEHAHYQRMLPLFSQDLVLTILDDLMEWTQNMPRSSFQRAALDVMLLHLIRAPRRISLPTLVRRLEELSHTAPQPTSPPPPCPPETAPAAHPSRYDTLLRFAAVELDGTLLH